MSLAEPYARLLRPFFEDRDSALQLINACARAAHRLGHDPILGKHIPRYNYAMTDTFLLALLDVHSPESLESVWRLGGAPALQALAESPEVFARVHERFRTGEHCPFGGLMPRRTGARGTSDDFALPAPPVGPSSADVFENSAWGHPAKP